MKGLLHDIRETEVHVEKILHDARVRAVDIIAKGKTDAATLVMERKQDLLTEKTEVIAAYKKELEKKEHKHIKNVEKQAVRVENRAKQFMNDAVADLLVAFKELVR